MMTMAMGLGGGPSRTAITRVLLILSGFVLTGCGATTSFSAAGSASSSPVTGAEPGVDTYLCSGSTNDTLLQWRNSDGELSGTYENAQLTGQAPAEQVNSNSGDLSGTLNGTAITLNIGLSQPRYGTLTSGQLTLNVPQSDGTIQAGTCAQSTLGDDTAAAISQTTSQGNSINSAAQQLATTAQNYATAHSC
jgi:hypothetical protein